MELDVIKTIAELGSAGISLAIILKLLPDILKNQREERQQFAKLLGNHVHHAELAQRQEAKAKLALSKSLDRLTKLIEDK